MRNPTVSFVVPCYNLAHLLPECVNSILLQTYTDFEVLIMDDCSPDNTAGIVRSFEDSRIRYIRNAQNLGHLANYNKGIKQSRGRYVWLISADDRLRRPYVLERYVRLMDHHPRVGYVCCPGIALQDGVETSLIDWSYYGSGDKIYNGRDFIAISLDKGCGLLAPAVMVRKDCYEGISDFPLDMPHQGDVYLWFRWALEYDVAYMGEPMVNYRLHEMNIGKDLARQGDSVIKDEVNVLWRTKHHCEKRGFRALASKCEYALAWKYARAAASAIYGGDNYYFYTGMNITQCDRALRDNASGVEDYKRLRQMFFESMGNQHWRHGDFASARQCYLVAVRENWRKLRVWLKIFILILGLGRMTVFLKNLANRLWAKLTAWERLASGCRLDS